MATKTKQQLQQQSDGTFPTNGQGQISAAQHRAFNNDLLDSVAFETDWLDVTNDLVDENTISLLGGSMRIDSMLIKRVGDVINMRIEATLSNTTTTYKGATFSLLNSIFDLGDVLDGGIVVASQVGSTFVFYYGEEHVVFAPLNVLASPKDTLNLSLTVPYYKT